MKTKIIHFQKGYFLNNKRYGLTALMIDALVAACEKQEEGVAFGPKDIKGSFSALVSRGLITRKKFTLKDISEVRWHVTNEALAMLKALGIIVPCGDDECTESFNMAMAY